MYKYLCSCGWSTVFTHYYINLEGTLTFRVYDGQCTKCLKPIYVKDINDADLVEQEFLC